MRARIVRQNGEAIITVPETAVDAAHLPDEAEVFVKGNLVVISTQQTEIDEEPTLDELLSQITDENRHELLDWGPPVGKEIW